MRKRAVLSLALAVVLLLFSACGGPQQSSVSEKAPESGGSAAEVRETFVSGNMQKNSPSGNFVSANGKILFTAVLENAEGLAVLQLMEYDPASGLVSTFCKDPTCDHSDKAEHCAAAHASCNLENNGADVFAMGFETLLKLNGDRFEPVLDSGVAGFFHAGDDLYVRTQDASLLLYENGKGTPKTLLEEYAGYWEYLDGDTLYYESGGFNRVQLSAEDPEPEVLLPGAEAITDGTHIYYTGDSGFLYRCSMDGENKELLFEQRVLPASWNYDETYFYFRLFDGDLRGAGSHEIYRMLKSDPAQVEKLAELPDMVYQIYISPIAGELFVIPLTEAKDSSGNKVDNMLYIVSTESGEFRKLEIS